MIDLRLEKYRCSTKTGAKPCRNCKFLSEVILFRMHKDKIDPEMKVEELFNQYKCLKIN